MDLLFEKWLQKNLVNISELNHRDLLNAVDAGSAYRQKNQNIYSRFKGVREDGVLLFSTVSGTVSGKWWHQKIELVDLPEVLQMIKDDVDMTNAEVVNMAVFGDIKVFCSCPAFLYWAYKYMAWGLDYGTDPENRSPKRNNVALQGSVCKHLISVLKILPFNISNILRSLKAMGLIPERPTPEEEEEVSESFDYTSIKSKRPWEMTLEEFKNSPPEGYTYDENSSHEADVRADGIIYIGKKFFSYPYKTRKAIIEHEKAHILESSLSWEQWDRVLSLAQEDVGSGPGTLPSSKFYYGGLGIINRETMLLTDHANPGEALTQYYSYMLHGEDDWVKENYPEARELIISLVKENNLPLPMDVLEESFYSRQKIDESMEQVFREPGIYCDIMFEDETLYAEASLALVDSDSQKEILFLQGEEATEFFNRLHDDYTSYGISFPKEEKVFADRILYRGVFVPQSAFIVVGIDFEYLKESKNIQDISRLMEKDSGDKGQILYHGSRNKLLSDEVEEGHGIYRSGVYMSTDRSVAEEYGIDGSVHTYRLSPEAVVLDLSTGEQVLEYILRNGILEQEDIDIDLENYILSGRIFQADPYNRMGIVDDIMETAKDQGYDAVLLYDDLGRDEVGNVATVIVNLGVISPLEESFQRVDEDYRMSHRPPEDGPPVFDLLGNEGEEYEWSAPSDIYENPQFYTGNPRSVSFKKTVKILRAIRGKSQAIVTVYRASPKNELNYGDWVALTQDYAKMAGMADIPSHDVPVYSYQVKAKDVRWAGDDLEEYGYFGEPISASLSERAEDFLIVDPSNIYYHGTSDPTLTADKIDPRHSIEVRGVVFFTSNVNMAAQFTFPREYGEVIFYDDEGEKLEEGVILEAYLIVNNPLVFEGEEAQNIIDDTILQSRKVEEAKESGYDSLVLKDVVEFADPLERGDVIGVFSREQIIPIEGSF